MSNAKPFLKWAGGKTQLLRDLENQLPLHIQQSREIKRYVEPFIGGGAFFFFLKNNYKIDEAIISDVNKEIIIGYVTIKNNHKKLINKLQTIQDDYLKKTTAERKEYYYQIRNEYNKNILSFNYQKYDSSWVERASQLIFLNKTCFNGLFRQNKKGEFNVPSGKYKNPKICDETNILAVNQALKNTRIKICDFAETKKYIYNETLVYLDPPYRPINNSSSFTSYSKGGFNEDDQIRLSNYYCDLDKIDANLILSNSDPQNTNPDDNFFDNLYENFNIKRVNATRMINSNASNRGVISELIIKNYYV